MSASLLVSGFDLVQFDVPEGAQVLLPPRALPPLQDFKESVARALDEPLAGPPIAKRVNAGSRICIVLDDPSLPVPPASNDARTEMLEAVFDALVSLGVKPARITALVANGLGRQLRPAELTEWLGARSTSQIAVRCHDAEQLSELVRIGDEPSGPIELSRHLLECDLLIHLNVVSMPLQAGPFGIIHGATGYRTARELNAPAMFAGGQSPLVPGSAWHQAHLKIAGLLEKKLMKDQVDALRVNGVEADFLNSNQTSREQTAVFKKVRAGLTKILYVAPERLLQSGDYSSISCARSNPRFSRSTKPTAFQAGGTIFAPITFSSASSNSISRTFR